MTDVALESPDKGSDEFGQQLVEAWIEDAIRARFCDAHLGVVENFPIVEVRVERGVTYAQGYLTTTTGELWTFVVEAPTGQPRPYISVAKVGDMKEL